MTAVTDIYNALIPTTTVAWTESLQTYAEGIEWHGSQRLAGFPILVAVIDGAVVGFGAYGHFRGEGKWPGYRSTAESSRRRR